MNGKAAKSAKVMLPIGPPRNVWPTISHACSLLLAASSEPSPTTAGIRALAALSAIVSAVPMTSAVR